MRAMFLLLVGYCLSQPPDVPLPARVEGKLRWGFSNGPEFPGAAGGLSADDDGTVRLRFDFTRGGAYVAAHRGLDRPTTLRGLSFRVRKPAAAPLTARVTDRTGQTVQKSVHFEHDQWQRVTVEMGGWTGHWGGADDGVVHQPVREIALLIERRDLDVLTGEMAIADVVAHPGQAVPTPPPHRGSYVVTDFGADAGFVAEGHGRLAGGRWQVDFANGAASLHHSISLLGRPRELSLALRGGPRGGLLKIRLGSHFQYFERELGTLEGGPQTLRVSMPPDGWRHFGGEEDGRVRHPLRVATLVAERGQAAAEPATIDLAELRCVTDVPRHQPVILMAAIADRGTAGADRRLSVTGMARNLLDATVSGTLTLTLRDWEGNTLHTATQPWQIPAGGVRTDQRWQAAVRAELNFAEAEVAFQAAGLNTPAARAAFTRPLDDPGDATLQPESFWGMGIYLYRYPDTAEGHKQMDRAATLARAAGVKWSREEFSWSRIEPRPGQFDFDFYDRVVDTARRHGVSIYGLLAYWSGWTRPYTEQGIDDFCRYARAVVRRYKDRIKHWEVYNEPNIFFWSGPRELYPVLLTRCHAAIKDEDPAATVLGISTAGIDTAFIRGCLDAAAPFDVLTIHPYRVSLQDGGFMRELRTAAQLVKGRPVWITEMGWSTEIGGTSERAQAQLLARCYLGALASGACQNVSWYNFRSDGTDPFYNEHHFGVLRHDLTPKAGYRALATICRTLTGGPPRYHGDFGDGVHAVEIGGAWAIWSAAARTQVAVRAGESVRVFNLVGEPLSPGRNGNLLALELQPGSPVFLSGAAIEAAANGPARGAVPMPDVVRF